MLLFDQLARNCFRGTHRAFKYDPQALVLAKRLVKEGEAEAMRPAVRHTVSIFNLWSDEHILLY